MTLESKLKIMKAEEKDRDALKILLSAEEEAFSGTPIGDLYAKTSREDWLKFRLNNDTYIAYYEEEAVSMITLRKMDVKYVPPDGEVQSIESVDFLQGAITLPDYRERGIMIRIIEYVEQVARERNVGYLYLAAESETSERLFSNIGYMELGKCCICNLYPDDCRAPLMRKEI
jgi:GNAT superfamily N-acetyltransferase